MRKTMCLRLAVLSWVAMAAMLPSPGRAQVYERMSAAQLERESQALANENESFRTKIESLRRELQQVRDEKLREYLERSKHVGPLGDLRLQNQIEDEYRTRIQSIQSQIDALENQLATNTEKMNQADSEAKQLRREASRKEQEQERAEKKRQDELDRQAQESKAKSEESRQKVRDSVSGLTDWIASRQQEAKDKAEARRVEEEREWNERQETEPPSPPPDTGGSSRYDYDDAAEDDQPVRRAPSGGGRSRGERSRGERIDQEGDRGGSADGSMSSAFSLMNSVLSERPAATRSPEPDYLETLLQNPASTAEASAQPTAEPGSVVDQMASRPDASGSASLPGYETGTVAGGGAGTRGTITPGAYAYPPRKEWDSKLAFWADQQVPNAKQFRPEPGGMWLHDGKAWSRKTFLPTGLQVPVPRGGLIQWNGREWKGTQGETVYWDEYGLPRFSPDGGAKR